MIKIKWYSFVASVVVVIISCSSESVSDQSGRSEDLKKAITTSAKLNDNYEVLLLCDSLIALNSKDYWVYQVKGIALYNTGDYFNAKKSLDISISLNDTAATALFWRGNVREALGDSLGAIADYSLGISIDPSSVGNYNNRGQLYKFSGNFYAALLDYNAAIRIDSSYGVLYANIGELYQRMGKPDSAIFYYGEGIKRDSLFELFFNRGLARYKQDQFVEAIDDFTIAIKLRPSESVGYLYRSYCYFRLDNKGLMCVDLQHATALKNEEAEKYFDLYCQ